jgi:hypothetical protein
VLLILANFLKANVHCLPAGGKDVCVPFPPYAPRLQTLGNLFLLVIVLGTKIDPKISRTSVKQEPVFLSP